MKNKVFNVWIKELCSLVFTQAVQAFVLAILMSVVVSLFITSLETSSRAIGVYAIIAMASLSKIELLVKSIFGIKSGVADTSMAAGGRSLLKTGLAIRGIARLGNNIPNIVGGAAGMILPSAESRRVRLAKEKLKSEDNAKKLAKSNTDARRIAGVSGVGNKRRLLKVGNSSGNSSSDGSSKKTPQEELSDAKAALAKKRRENLSKVTGGTLETIGAFHGGVLGAGVGLATGDNVLEDVGIGIGIGDTIGSAANKYSVGLYSQAMNELDDMGTINTTIQKQKSDNREFKEKSNKTISQNNRAISDAVKNNTANISSVNDAKVVRKAQNMVAKEDYSNQKNNLKNQKNNYDISSKDYKSSVKAANEAKKEQIKANNEQFEARKESFNQAQKEKKQALRQQNREKKAQLNNSFSGGMNPSNNNNSGNNSNSGQNNSGINRKI